MSIEYLQLTNSASRYSGNSERSALSGRGWQYVLNYKFPSYQIPTSCLPHIGSPPSSSSLLYPSNNVKDLTVNPHPTIPGHPPANARLPAGQTSSPALNLSAGQTNHHAPPHSPRHPRRRSLPLPHLPPHRQRRLLRRVLTRLRRASRARIRTSLRECTGVDLGIRAC